MMGEQRPSDPVDRDVGLDREAIMREWDRARKWIADGDRASLPRDWFESVLDQYDERLDRLRADRDALAMLLGECADELETEIHCRLGGDKATLRLELPHRAKAKLREIGLPHGLVPNAEVSGGRSPSA